MCLIFRYEKRPRLEWFVHANWKTIKNNRGISIIPSNFNIAMHNYTILVAVTKS